MKRNLITLIAGLLFSCSCLFTNAQEFREHISKEFTPAKQASATTLSIYNFDGFIKVESYNGDKVIMEIDKSITADDKEKLEFAKKELKLEFDQYNDTIIAYLSEPFDTRPHRDWHERNRHWEDEYKFHLNFTVKVPAGINLNVSTVLDGIVSVKDVSGTLHLNNVNGAISVVNAKNTTVAHTVNGGVDVSYLSNPPGSSSYYTVNGEIKVSYASGLSADMEFKSLNGEYFTDFPDVTMLPVKAIKTQNSNGDGTTFRIHKSTTARFGSGGPVFKFETINGNIYIKKQS